MSTSKQISGYRALLNTERPDAISAAPFDKILYKVKTPVALFYAVSSVQEAAKIGRRDEMAALVIVR